MAVFDFARRPLVWIKGSKRRRSGVIATALALVLALMGSVFAVADAAPTGPRLKLTDLNREVLVVRGYDFPTGAEVAISATIGADKPIVNAKVAADGRFAGTFLVPRSLNGIVTVTAVSGDVTASASRRYGIIATTTTVRPTTSTSTTTTAVPGVPGPVASMALDAASNNTLRLSWSAPTSAGASAVLGYKIGWTESGTNRQWDTTGAHYQLASSPLTLIGLIPGTSYNVRITAYNAVGDGPTTTRVASTIGGASPTTSTPGTTPPSTPPTTTPATTPATTVPANGTLPAKIVAGYWQMWQGPHVSEITAAAPQYNLQYAAFALGRGQNNGLVSFDPVFSSPDRLKADIAASKAKGSTWLLSIGGGSETGLRLLNPTHVDQMMSTITPIIDAYGFQGIDWDFEGGYNQWNSASAKDVSLKLKAKYGSKFVISAAPRPYEDQYREWAVSMGPALDLFGYQFYDFPETRDTTFLRNYINMRVDQAVAMGIPASKIMIGAITYTQYNLGWNSVTVYRDIFKEVERKHPALRGVYIWETSLDKKENWSFAKTMGPAVRGVS